MLMKCKLSTRAVTCVKAVRKHVDEIDPTITLVKIENLIFSINVLVGRTDKEIKEGMVLPKQNKK